MPELPEVETTRRGLAPHLIGRRIAAVRCHRRDLRWPVPAFLQQRLAGQVIRSIGRRGKYLVLDCGKGSLILHLGMSGSLLLLPAGTPRQSHEHFELIVEGGQAVRLRDPRRFGAVLWEPGPVLQNPLLAGLGPEPLESAFSGEILRRAFRTRSATVKQVIMDSHVVAGVGNIYASEALFRARIHPRTPARRLSAARCERLAAAIRATLEDAIQAGGSSLRDFVGSDGSPGYFQQHYFVYARPGEPCRRCGTPIRAVRLGQRSTFFCPSCQK